MRCVSVCTHVSVFVVTVGGQKDLGDLVHSAQKERQLRLQDTHTHTHGKNAAQQGTPDSIIVTWTKHGPRVCVCEFYDGGIGVCVCVCVSSMMVV